MLLRTLFFSLCLVALTFLSSFSYAESQKTQLDDSDLILKEYLEALKKNNLEKAAGYCARGYRPPEKASTPCEAEAQRIIREHGKWKIDKKLKEKNGEVFFEIVFDEPDLNPIISRIVQRHFAEVFKSKGAGAANTKLCEITATELARTSKTEIDKFPIKRTVQCYQLQKFETGWKIIGQKSSPCQVSQGLPETRSTNGYH